MGVEISTFNFSKSDFSLFDEKVDDETKLLREWFSQNRFSNELGKGGFELECWLVDSRCRPAPANVDFIKNLGDPQTVPELTKYNFEINSLPFSIKNRGLLDLKQDLQNRWERAEEVAKKMNLRVMMIGILPTAQRSHMNIANINGANSR